VGTSVTITGTYLGATQGAVTFNGTAATIASWSATSIVAVVPTGATTGNVVVTASGVAIYAGPFIVLEAPTFSPGGGVYSSPQMVTISDLSADATIYYTVKSGSTGTPVLTSSPVYTGGAISVGSTETFEAIAVVPGYQPSPVAIVTYTLPAIATSTTALAVTSSGSPATSVSLGSVVTLTATVASGTTPVTTGTVNFCDATVTATHCTDIHLLGTAQLTPAGTAAISIRPAIGSPSYKAIFVGTSTYAASTSSTAKLTVTATGSYPTTTTIAATGAAGNYTVTSTVTGMGSNTFAPTGIVSILDTSNANAVLGTASLSGANAIVGFTDVQTYGTGTAPAFIAVGDFTGKGKLDLAVPNFYDSTVTILLSNGDGTFTPAIGNPVAVGWNPVFAAVGDFNGDGKLDLAVANSGRNTVTILLGNGDGTFTPASGSPVAVGNVPYSIAVGDFNGDGKLDLAVANSGSNTVTILLGNGDGTFTPAIGSPVAVGSKPYSVAVGDFNGDGRLDLAVANGLDNTVTILLGNGDGTFTPAIGSPVAVGSVPFTIAVGDFDGDGKPDLAVANGRDTTVTILLGQGGGAFKPAPQSPVTVGDGPGSIAVGDFNGDGKLDLAVGNAAGMAVETILLGNGDGTFQPAPGSPVTVSQGSDAIALGDFNGDGTPDLAVANQWNNTVTILQTNLLETVTLTGIAPAGSGTHNVDASYGGDSIFAASASPTIPLQTVPNTMIASLVPVESRLGSPVSVNISLIIPTGAIPAGTVSCSGAGVTSAPVSISSNGSATVQMNGLPLGQDVIVCAFTSSGNFSNAASSPMIESVIMAPVTGSVSVTPASAKLYGGQTQQFSASVLNTSNQTVAWTISPLGAGAIGESGLYSAPPSVTSEETVTITATSQADTAQSASAMITLSPPPCAASGYSYERSIVIDHTKVPNTDQTDFPFLFNTTDPTFKTTAIGGHVSNSNGYDIIFSTDPGGLTKLDHELEQYDPVHGQVTAWIRIPTLSHTADTILYVFYGNASVKASQQNRTGVWDSNNTAVYHLANVGASLAADSTANGNNAPVTSLAAATGQIDGAADGAAGFNGASSYLQIPAATFSSYPTSGSTTAGFSASFGTWFKTASAGVILGQTDGTEPGGNPGGWQPALFIDTAGRLRASIFSHGSMDDQIAPATTYNDNNWHFAVDTYANGTEELYVDGQFAGSQQVAEFGYNSAYAYFVGTGETAGWPAANGSWLYFSGALDEVTVSNIARSADWVQTEYTNQSSPSTFYALHPENAEEVLPATVSLYDGQSRQFTILGSVAGSCNSPAAIWSMPAGMPGTLTTSGLYTAPDSISSQQPVPITATILGDSTKSISAMVTLRPLVTVSLAPSSVILTAGQTQQFTANVANTSNTAVTWTNDPAGLGTITAGGLFTASASLTVLETETITATSRADPTQSASATITLTPTPITPIPPSSQCGSSGYSSQRVIVIDHTKVPHTDQFNFPFLFNTVDADLATIANGGHVASANGNDIFFSLDPNGLTKLDHELEEYNPGTGTGNGQVVAWVRIPTLSHTTDTVLYLFYGNPNVASPLQNPQGVWDSNYEAVYHLANAATSNAADSTVYGNSGVLSSVSPASGQIDGAAALNGTSSYLQIPAMAFPSYPTGAYDYLGIEQDQNSNGFSASFGIWFKTASWGGLLDQTAGETCGGSLFCIWQGPEEPGDQPDGSWDSMLDINWNGSLEGRAIDPTTHAYNDNNWHFAVETFNNGVNKLYADGQLVGTGNDGTFGFDSSYAYFVGTQYPASDDSTLDQRPWMYLNGEIDEISVSSIARSSDWIQAEYNNQGYPSTFYSLSSLTSVQVVPSAATLFPTQSQQFAVAGACNASVTWTMPSGAQGTLTSSGLYTAPESVAAQQIVTLTAAGQNGTAIGSAPVTLLPSPAPITLAAPVTPPYATGTAQTFVATLKDQNGTPESGVTVTFMVVGVNGTVGSGITGSDGTASYTYTGAIAGTDTIQATAIVNEQLQSSNSVTATWIVQAPPITAPSVTLMPQPALGRGGLVGAFTDYNGAVIEPIAIGAAARTFVVPAGARQLQLGIDDNYYEDNGGSGFVVSINGFTMANRVPPTAMPWKWQTGGLNNDYQYGINDGTDPVVAAAGLTAGKDITIAYQSGTVSTDSPSRPLVDAGGEQTFITGIQLWQGAYFPTMYTTATSYPEGLPITVSAVVKDATGAPIPNVSVTLSATGANLGQYQASSDATGTATFSYVGQNAGVDTLQAEAVLAGNAGVNSSPSTINWTIYPEPPSNAGSLTLTEIVTNVNSQSFVSYAMDASGSALPNVNVGYYITGVDNFQSSGTTDDRGESTFGYYHLQAGNYKVIAVDSVGRNVIVTPPYTGNWVVPIVPQCPSCSGGTITVGISAPTTVTMPNAVQLTGSVTDSSQLTVTDTWTEVSGPGSVTFASPSSAVTTATFSQVGTYVLQLFATDGSNSGWAQITVTVTQASTASLSQGWIGSPAYGSAVSGVVPIQLAPGVTLQNGASNALIYYPANNPGNTTTLPIKAASDTIATLDTTTLVNGSYWIQLQATDQSGSSEYSLVMVTVGGNYKPGRVTATVTDLVVPATGLAINIQRTYDSLNAATSSDFGYGWSLGINVNLTVDPAGNVTFTLGGQRKTFYLTPWMPPCSPLIGCLFPYTFVAYTPEPGLHGTLTDGGTTCPLDMLVPNGSMWNCQGGGPFNPAQYIYTDPSGTSYTIGANGNLQSIQDLSGNGLTITANGITSTTGLSVPFVRDSSKRITQITDPQGNVYQYAYDANGNLVSVTYPATAQSTACPGTPAPNTSTYTYDPTFIHLYAGGTDGRCNPLPTSNYYSDGRLQSVTVSPGNGAASYTTGYAYDLTTNTTTVTNPDGGHQILVYDSYGDLLQSTDPNNLTTVNTYDANHNLTSVTDPLGHVNSYTYDANGNKTSSTYPSLGTGHNTTSYTVYNQYSEPMSATDELGNVRVFNYDANYLPQSVTDSLGTLASFVFNANQTLQAGAIGYDITANPAMASQFSYDADGNLASRTDALGRTTSYTYDSLGHKLSMTTPTPALPAGSADSTTVYSYDALGNLVQTAAPLGRTTSSAYDANGNKSYDIDARGYKTSYVYDALNRLVETDYPDQTKSTKSYDFRNNVIDEIDQAKNDTHHVYDPGGRQTSVTRGSGSTTTTPSITSYTYYDDGRKETETDALQHTTNYNYDAAGRLISVSGVGGNIGYSYDDAGNQTSRTDGNNNTTNFKYDARKRLTETDYPDQTSVKNTYDGPGNLASVTDQAQNVVQYTYDAANQLKTVEQVNSPNSPQNTNQYTYDLLGNLTNLTDENGNTTVNAFNVLYEPTQKTLPAAQTETRTYDEAGNLQTLTHFNGKTTTYTYDKLNRLLGRSTPGEASDSVSFTYTPTGKYLTSTAQDGTVNYSYDALDRLTTKVTPEGTLSYTYYPAGQVESINSSNAHGVSVGYTYDDLNRLSTVVDNRLQGSNITSYTYDNASNVATVKYPNGLTSTFTYDTLSRLTELATPPIADYKYTLGLTGLRTGATEQSGRTLTWNYDGIYRLTNEAISSDPSNNNGSVSYGLDPVGNRSSAASSLSPVQSGSWTYNADDEISSETYDADGNVLAAGGVNYTYDSENRMTSMTGNGKVVTMVYDAFGSRVSKTVNGTTTQYLVEDDVNPTGLPQVLEEVQNGSAVRTYTYGLQRISENLSPVVTGNSTWTPSFYGYDGFGSVRQLTNLTGVVTDEYEYDAFGNSFTKQGTTPNNYLYRGEQYDSDLGLYYLRARYYNPNTGRFLSRDPLEGDPADPQSLHKYLYAGGDPVNRIDPSGRADSIETIFTITVIATPTEVALSALAGQATAAIALLQMAAGQAYLTAQYAFELIAAAGEATGISKLLVCGAVGLVVAQVEAEHKITNPEKTAIGLAFSYACARIVPLPGPPPIKW
jgi:RHS repeat-associated protein